jgi:uncharacterized protein (TIGR02271 family)
MQTVIGGFDDRATADQAVQRLLEMGFDRSDVHVESNADGGSAVGGFEEREVKHQHHGFFARLFGLDGDGDTYATHANTWNEAVRRGSAVVVVDAADGEQADRAAGLLHEMGAIDVNERAKQWRADGWTDGAQTQGLAAGTRSATGAVADGKVLDVVQEELEVGKRQLDRGGVRVVERVSQQPVREIVKLREERAVVERRPVNREATDGDLIRDGESAIEIREMTEEPVVAKRARVVEEVRVGKEVREREQTIEDKVRRKDVDVQRLDGGVTRDQREGALAADRALDTPASERGGLRTDGDLADRDLLGRKDKPL